MTTAPAPTPPHAATPRPRLGGVDLARGLAIIGMISVHVAPPLAGEGGWYALPYGRSSTLFVLVAGLGITLGSRRGTTATNVSRLLWRAAWLAPLGLFLGALGTPVAVILQYYALWFVLAAPLLRASTRALAWITGLGVLLGPTVLLWSQVVHPEWYAPGRGVWLGTLGDVLLTGYYPTVSWFWLVTLGMALARQDLHDMRVVRLLVVVGSCIAIAAYAAAAALRDVVDLGRWQPLLDTVGHSDTTVEQIAVAGVSVAVLGVCLLMDRYARPLVAPGVALGRFALSVYVGHIMVYAVVRGAMFSTTPEEGALTTLAVTAASTVIAMLWLAVLPRGPLEALDRGGHRRLVLPLVRLVGLRTQEDTIDERHDHQQDDPRDEHAVRVSV